LRHYDLRLVTRADKRQRQKERSRAAREAREVQLKRQQRRSIAIRVGAGLVVAAIAIGIAMVVTGGSDDDTAADTTTTTPTTPTTTPNETFAPDPTKTYSTISTNFGEIWAELDTTTAPVAAVRFIELAESGFYDGLTWHRVVPDFVIQGGDPEGTGAGSSGTSVVGEVPTDNYPVGALAAAKTATDPPGTFDSQFFIVTGSQGATLPNEYARFGAVVSGIEVAQEIEALAPPEGDGPPTQAATIDTITIVRPTSDASTTSTTAAG
jgi:peptidyl-prolyl cis-trans isomerase B (cyclophilin B)